MKTKTYPPGYFTAPVRAWKGMRFESQIRVDAKTKRMVTDYERQQRIRESGGWGTLPWAKA